MQRLHLLLGTLGLVAFLGTGVFMRVHEPPLAEYDPFLRALFRSRHIYLMFGATLNVLLGLHLREHLGLPRLLQRAGSALVLASPPLALAGFVRDPAVGSLAGAMLGKYSAFSAFGGTMLHLVAALLATRGQAGARAHGTRP